jgi:hypothetical protein
VVLFGICAGQNGRPQGRANMRDVRMSSGRQ